MDENFRVHATILEAPKCEIRQSGKMHAAFMLLDLPIDNCGKDTTCRDLLLSGSCSREDERTPLGLLVLTCFSVSCAVAKEDETPMGIAERFGIDVDCLCKMNVDMYQGLHSRARFKNGTLLMLPTPTPGSLKRPATRPPLQILKDLVGVVRIEMQVGPLRTSNSRFCSKRTTPGSLRIAHIAYN